ncbi:hypothetical protein HPB48_019053 [Haemaphysalis longicornis]|uniref:Uncharacterized protein n=1 Tax=Haemaphysalis longicornis TaxID=44386 RepID=A0A9J6GJC4_HAELO|nr:hypothetical protein HPB48_019053 [Haemaphysalis longicornis]
MPAQRVRVEQRDAEHLDPPIGHPSLQRRPCPRREAPAGGRRRQPHRRHGGGGLHLHLHHDAVAVRAVPHLQLQSKQVYQKLLKYDLVGVAMSLWATVSSGVVMAFDEHPFSRFLYIAVEAVLLVGILWKAGTEDTGIFCSLAAFGLLPTIHWLFLAPPYLTRVLPWLVLLFLSSGFSYLVLEGRCPERLRPGYYDYVGSSHQIWHILVVFITMLWHETALAIINCKNGHC